jgi:hypothetical protein
LSKITGKASSETNAALLDLKKQGATKIILDIRGNLVGFLGEAINVCDLFVPINKTIVATKSKVEKYNSICITTNELIDSEIPVVIIENGKVLWHLKLFRVLNKIYVKPLLLEIDVSEKDYSKTIEFILWNASKIYCFYILVPFLKMHSIVRLFA